MNVQKEKVSHNRKKISFQNECPLQSTRLRGLKNHWKNFKLNGDEFFPKWKNIIFSHYKKAHRKIIYFVSVEFVIRSLPLAMGKDLTSKSFGGFWPACPLIELLRRFCFPEKYYTLNRVTDNRKSAGIILTFSRWGCMVGIRMIQYSSSSKNVVSNAKRQQENYSVSGEFVMISHPPDVGKLILPAKNWLPAVEKLKKLFLRAGWLFWRPTYHQLYAIWMTRWSFRRQILRWPNNTSMALAVWQLAITFSAVGRSGGNISTANGFTVEIRMIYSSS